ncbi:carbon-nitrogen hydrolase family protein [Limibaculum sp. FT325]|uniref:carbon-nitrogen hydrolase family protein n=1 Tax=Thermohalobaculum sediminis TaxID=2939436 RepID=UPI0020C15D66|nr:carbon-nitrogen hydrolase family protein [Limibaculum sediminis]MCL5777082.1 carbon-nitrogen hydrolase family protein [Limibaculum sediminis]
MELRAALVQLNASDDPTANLGVTERLVREAAEGGAQMVLTPEVTNIVSASRARQRAMLRAEGEDPTLAGLREVARASGIWLVIGSLALRCEADERFVNRSFVIRPDGSIAARYDKIHMFDVDLEGAESYRESAGYRPGEQAVTVDTPWGRIGLGICYDMRFPALYRALAEAGAVILTAPSAFTVPTGRAHWEILLRARAIETGCFMLAPAQWGTHDASEGRVRETWGHSIAIDPWGRVLADAGEGVGVTQVTLDLAEVARVRASIPSLANARVFRLPRPDTGTP